MKPNVIFFSSGESERNGNLKRITDGLSDSLQCYCWRDIFAKAKEPNHIALLPILIKKIPTFDFAILLCEGHDTTKALHNGVYDQIFAMRDNVIFEIGLASMALGLTRVILLTDSMVHLPEDLIGIHGETAIKQFIFQDQITSTIPQVLEYIDQTKNDYFPVVVGAAASTAMGYFQNFILRSLESWNGQLLLESGEAINIPVDNLRFRIYIPQNYSKQDEERSLCNLQALPKGYIRGKYSRDIEVRFKSEGSWIEIIDVPTTLKTSYAMADLILNLEADEELDTFASERFVNKEFALFAHTLEYAMKDTNRTATLLKVDESQVRYAAKNVNIILDWL